MKVVTYQTSQNDKINICSSCADRFRSAGEWPRNRIGEEYHSVYQGAHNGYCDAHGQEVASIG